MTVTNADLTEVKLSFPVRTSLLFALCALAADAAYWFITKSPNDTLVFSCATAAAVGGILAAIYAARTLNFQILQSTVATKNAAEALAYQRKVFSMQYASRWNEPHMEAARKACREVIELNGNGVEEIEKQLSANDRQLKAVHLLNFLEEIGTSIKCELADADILKETYRDAVVLVWRSMGNWALHYREKHRQPNAWKNLEEIYKQWS